MTMNKKRPVQASAGSPESKNSAKGKEEECERGRQKNPRLGRLMEKQGTEVCLKRKYKKKKKPVFWVSRGLVGEARFAKKISRGRTCREESITARLPREPGGGKSLGQKKRKEFQYWGGVWGGWKKNEIGLSSPMNLEEQGRRNLSNHTKKPEAGGGGLGRD